MEIQIVAIKINGPPNDCTCITDVKSSTDLEYPTWLVISMIQNGTRFYVTDPKDGSKAYVVPVPEHAPSYIRTKANDTHDDNLLKLPLF